MSLKKVKYEYFVPGMKYIQRSLETLRFSVHMFSVIKRCSLSLVLNTVNPVYSANTSKSNLEGGGKKGKAGNCLFIFAAVRNRGSVPLLLFIVSNHKMYL